MVCTGTPDDLKAHATSHTGQALREYDGALGAGAPSPVEEGRPLQALVPCRPPARPTRDPHRQRAAAQPEEPERRHPARQVQRGHRRQRFSGKATLAFDIPVQRGQRRYLESLNAYARSIVQPAGRPEVDAVYGIPPTVAIEQRLSRGGRPEHGGHHHRGLALPAPAVGEAGPAALRARRRRGVPAEPESIAAQVLRQTTAASIGLLAPLVVNRKGVYTELAKWAPARATPTCAWTASSCRPPFPRIDRFKEHTIELPVADLVVTPRTRPRCARLLAKALEHGKGVVHLSDLDGTGRAMPWRRRAAPAASAAEGVLHQARLPGAAPATRAGPAHVQLQQQARLVPHCVGTGLR